MGSHADGPEQQGSLPFAWLGAFALAGILSEIVRRVLEAQVEGWLAQNLVRVMSILVLSTIAYFGIQWIRRSHSPKFTDLLAPRRRHWFRLCGWLLAVSTGGWAVFLTIATLIPVAPVILEDSGNAIKAFKTTVSLDADSETLRLGESLKLRVKLDGEQLPSGYSARWTADPRMSDVELNPVTGFFQPSESLLQPGETKDVRVIVQVFDRNRQEIGSDETTIRVSYHAIAKLVSNADRVIDGTVVHFDLWLNGSQPTNGYSYIWTSNALERSVSTTEPYFTLKTQRVKGESESDITMNVQVLDFDKTEVATAGKKVVVVAPLPYFVGIVIDASDRMSRPDVNGKTWLEAAKDALNQPLDIVETCGGQVGIWCFGSRSDVSTGMPCQHVTTTYPIGSDMAEARNQATGIAIGGKDAPLALAIRNAARGLSAYRGDPDICLELVVITGGHDTCASGQIKEYLNNTKEALMAAGFAQDRLRFKFHCFTLATATNDAAIHEWQTLVQSGPYAESVEQTVFIAKDAGELQSIVRNITLLHSASSGFAALDQLITSAAAMGDFSAKNKLTQYVNSLRP